MKLVIPMAGYGKRLRPHTHSRPKPLVNVAGQPMLKYLLDSLGDLDIDEYIFIVGYLGEQIKEFVEKNYDINARYVVQEELIGQAHAIYLAREYLTGPALVLFADTLHNADLSLIKSTDADALIYVKEVDDPRRFGVVVLDEEERITHFIEKPDSFDNRLAVIGLYYIRDSERLIRAIETQMARNQITKGEFYIADAFQIMIEEGAVFRAHDVEMWLDCGKPETVLETNRYLLEHGFDNSKSITIEGVAVIPPVFIDPAAKVENAVIGPYATISAGSTIKNGLIRNSIIEEGAEVSGVILQESIVGRNARVHGGHHKLNVGADADLKL